MSLDFRVEARREKRDRVVKKESCYEVKKMKIKIEIEEPDRLKRIGPKGGEQIRIMEVDQKKSKSFYITRIYL